MQEIIRLAGKTDQNAPLLVEVNNPIMLKELALDLYKRLDMAIKALEAVCNRSNNPIDNKDGTFTMYFATEIGEHSRVMTIAQQALREINGKSGGDET